MRTELLLLLLSFAFGIATSELPTVYHLHIQKTSGTSLAADLVHICGCQCPRDMQFTWAHRHRCGNCSRCHLYSMFAGDVGRYHADLPYLLDWHYQNSSRKPYIVTFLRDPVQRCWSEYRYCVAAGSCWGSPVHLDPYRFFSDPAYTGNNRQAKAIGGELYECGTAERMLPYVDFVGRTETYDRDIARLASEWKAPVPPPRKLNSAALQPVPEPLVDFLETLNQLDIKLLQ